MKLKDFKEWIAAFVAGGLLVNAFVFVYDRPIKWINVDGGATEAVLHPSSYYVRNSEGFGIHKTDKNGYFNTGKLIDNDYILVIGASYTQGKEVEKGSRFTDIINKEIKEKRKLNDNELVVYNISQGAYYFPSVLKGFKATINNFPNSETVIIEIGRVDFNEEEIRDAQNFREYKETKKGDELYNSLSFKDKTIGWVLEYFPLTSLLGTNLSYITGTETSNNNVIDKGLYYKYLDSCLSDIKNTYSGNLAIMYHPNVILNKDGMAIVKEECLDIVDELCKKNNITFINMGDFFIDEYQKNYNVPYGFNNTVMASGHLNSSGNKVIAEVLLTYLSSLEKGNN